MICDKEGVHVELRDRLNILYADGCVAKELRFSVALP
jgi:prepilin-type processing-associated H-X9-DG protein